MLFIHTGEDPGRHVLHGSGLYIRPVKRTKDTMSSETYTLAPPTERNDMITGLGIISFINTGLFLLLYGIGILAMGTLKDMPQEQYDEVMTTAMEKYFQGDQLEEIMSMMQLVKDQGVTLMLLLFALTAFRLFSVFRMWRMQRSGFMMYAGAQVARVLAPVILMGAAFMSWFGAFMAAVMVVLYYTQLKHMR